MWPYVARRLGASAVLLLTASFVMFLLVAGTIDPLADLRLRQPPPSAATLDAQAHRLGLDRALVVRYVDWLGAFLGGDMGPSTRGVDIERDLADRLLTTIRLVVPAVALGLLLAVAAGTLGAVRRYGAVDHGMTAVALLVMSMPSFWLAGIGIQLALWLHDRFGIRMWRLGDSPVAMSDPSGWMVEQLQHAFLPTMTLALVLAATWSRFSRAAVIETLPLEYVRTARAKGLARSRVIGTHVLRSSLPPLTSVVALDAGAVVGGTVLIERAFDWNGMGEMLVESVQYGDVNRLLAWLLVTGTAIVLCNLAADVIVAWSDPRTRHGQRRGRRHA